MIKGRVEVSEEYLSVFPVLGRGLVCQVLLPACAAAVAGKGTFVHPDAFDLLRGGALREPIDDPELRRRVADYLADQQTVTIRYHWACTLDEKNAALQDLLGHADTHSRLIDEVIKYQADHGNFAQPPALAAVTSDDQPPATPTKRRSSRTREPKQ